MLTPRKISQCSYQALVDTINHDGIEHAGYLAFLFLLSIFPFLVFLFAIAGFIGHTDIGLKLISIILDNQIIPAKILHSLEPRFEEIESGPPQGLLTFAILGAIWTASSAVEGLRTTLNRAYRVHTPPAYIWRRLLSIGQFLVLTAVVIFVILTLIATSEIWEDLKPYLRIERINFHNETFTSIWPYARYFLTSLTLFMVVCFTYYILPNIKQKWKDVVPGALFVIVLWFIAGTLFSAYLSRFNQVNIIYGSLGGLIAALLFFYITAMILVYGAEFNYQLEKAKGRRIEEKIS
jgi:membrane protein